MSAAPEQERKSGLRAGFDAELEQLRLQVELMAVRVDQNLERMREVLLSGDQTVAERAVNADDDIDAMNVSLTERCYEILVREQPVASDLRFVVSVLRVLGDIERVGDLALRVVKRSNEHALLLAHDRIHDILMVMANEAIDRYRSALRAWAMFDLGLASELATSSSTLDLCDERLTAELLALREPEAVRIAMAALVMGRSLERIADHARIIGARLRYLITGDPEHLITEVR